MIEYLAKASPFLVIAYALLLHVAGIVAIILVVVSIWRLGKAHQRIASILGEYLLGDKPKAPPSPRPCTDDIPRCPSCGRIIPAGETRCPRCDWVPGESPSATVDRLKDQGRL